MVWDSDISNESISISLCKALFPCLSSSMSGKTFGTASMGSLRTLRAKPGYDIFLTKDVIQCIGDV